MPITARLTAVSAKLGAHKGAKPLMNLGSTETAAHWPCALPARRSALRGRVRWGQCPSSRPSKLEMPSLPGRTWNSQALRERTFLPVKKQGLAEGRYTHPKLTAPLEPPRAPAEHLCVQSFIQPSDCAALQGSGQQLSGLGQVAMPLALFPLDDKCSAWSIFSLCPHTPASSGAPRPNSRLRCATRHWT
jgi:hypothetical protein